MVVQIKRQLLEYGAVQRGRLGVRIQDLTPELAEAFGIDARRGAVITRVNKDSMADSAGLRAGDVVVRANGKRNHQGR